MSHQLVIARANALLVRKYDPDQPRADDGKWSKAGVGAHLLDVDAPPIRARTILRTALRSALFGGVLGTASGAAAIGTVVASGGAVAPLIPLAVLGVMQSSLTWGAWGAAYGIAAKILQRRRDRKRDVKKADTPKDLQELLSKMTRAEVSQFVDEFTATLSASDTASLTAALKKKKKPVSKLDRADELLLRKKLGPDATVEDWIKDFVHSTNPRFEGKSKKERIRMALGAYYGSQRKVSKAGFDPDQERDEFGRWSEGGGAMRAAGRMSVSGSAPPWATGGGGGEGLRDPNAVFEELFGAGERQLPLRERDWRALSEREKRDRLNDVFLELQEKARSRDFQTQKYAKDRLNELNNARNQEQMFEIAGRYHESNRKAFQERAAHARMANMSFEEDELRRAAELGTDQPLRMKEIRELQGLRRQAAETTETVGRASATGRVMLDVLRTAAGESTPEIIGRTAAVLGALTSIASAIHVASRARDVNTGAAAVRGVHDGIRQARSSLPGLVSASKEAKGEIKSKLSSFASRTAAALRDVETKVGRSEFATSAARSIFRASGGTIISNPVPRMRNPFRSAPYRAVRSTPVRPASFTAPVPTHPTISYTTPGYRRL